MYYIYKIEFEDGKNYVGITTDLKRRCYQHKSKAKQNSQGSVLYNSIKQNGIDKLQLIEIEQCASKHEAVLREEWWIENLNSIENGYNLSPGRNIPFKGFDAHMRHKFKNDKQWYDKIIGALKSNEEKRKESLRTDSFRKLVSDRNLKLIKEGKSKLPVHRRPIYCHQTSSAYASAFHAAKALNGSRKGVYRVATGERKSHKGLTFCFMEDIHT